MRKLMIAALAVLAFVGQALADGDCDRSMWGNNEAYQSHDAGNNETVEIRTCIDQSNHYNHIDIRNSNGYSLCVSTKADKKGNRWNGWEVKPGGVLSFSSTHRDEEWYVGAVQKSGEYCRH